MSRKRDYGEALKDPRWQKKRLEVMERDGWRCVMCNASSKTLHVHHRVYSKGDPWDVADNDLHTLCDSCHDLFHGVKKHETMPKVRDFVLEPYDDNEVRRSNLQREIAGAQKRIVWCDEAISKAAPGAKSVTRDYAVILKPTVEAEIAELRAQLAKLESKSDEP